MEVKQFQLGKKRIGDCSQPFIIAEAGVNHSGNFTIAKKMVEAAARFRADAVTFQHIDAKDFNVEPTNINFWEKLRLTNTQLEELFRLAKDNGLLTTACVINKTDLDYVVDLGVDFIKIVSGDISCHPFLEECAKTKLPIFLSTGASTMDEVRAAVKVITSSGNEKLTIYHTCINYPTPLEEVNLDIIDLYKKEFNFPIGYCDHTEGDFVSLLAVSKGIAALEKHFSLDRNKKGPDYEVSLEPPEFKAMVDKINKICLIKGKAAKYILDSEKNKYLATRRSVVAKVKIAKSSIITKDKLAYKRPGIGLQADRLNKILGKKAKKDIAPNEFITLKEVKG